MKIMQLGVSSMLLVFLSMSAHINLAAVFKENS